MDKNKYLKLQEIHYKIYRCCGSCMHANYFNDDWSTCKIHVYNHQKHSESLREMSIFKYGSCSQYVPIRDLGMWEDFLEPTR